MKTILKIALAFVVLSAGAGIAAVNQTASRPLVNTGEAPELGRLGSLSVGTNVALYEMPGRAKITMMGAVTGRLPIETRKLSVRFWYPATVAGTAPRALYRHVIVTPGKPDFVIEDRGIAVENALALSGQRYPLVLMSHGYRGWSSRFSNLAENLASKGYVVAAIDHNDAAFNNVPSFQMSFGNVMLDRALDQRQILTQILAQASTATSGMAAQIDPDKVGLLGYSMGGFGALATAGAPYDGTSKTIKALPAEAQRALMNTDSAVSGKIKALVAIAPWGAQPDNRSWRETDLAKIAAPVLLIAGDHDDVVDFKAGVSWLFNNLSGTDRHLLVFKEARHNVVGNPVEFDQNVDFSTVELFAEPVWRADRIGQINHHFVTAFFDTNLKGESAKATYLASAAIEAGQSEWPIGPGEQLGGKFAGTAQPKHWQGFQRRWAMGLQLHKGEKGITAALGSQNPAPAPR